MWAHGVNGFYRRTDPVIRLIDTDDNLKDMVGTRMQAKLLPICVVGLSALMACSSVETSADGDAANGGGIHPISTEGLKQACFYVRDVNNWDPLNQVNLIVYAPNRNRVYLLTIAPPAMSVRFSSNIAFTGIDNRICGRPGDRILIGAGVGERHTVMDVRRLDTETLDGLLADRQAQKDKPDKPGEESPQAEAETTPADDKETPD